jgi:D-amino-acid dehydrogenase
MLPEFGGGASEISPSGIPVCTAMQQSLASSEAARTSASHSTEYRMAELKADVLVLGAGMVGVSAAVHLQKRGRDVILIDRHEAAGEGTSFGNAGLIESASVFPYMFPRDFAQILRYAMNNTPQVRYELSDLPAFLPWLLRYFLASSPKRALHSAMAELPLIRRSLLEHEALMAEAGVPELLRRTGWLKLFRSDATLANAVADFERAKQYGVTGEILDGKAIAAREPHLSGEFAGAVYLPGPGFVPDPGALAKAYAALFERKGGRFMMGDARSIEQHSGGWRVAGPGGAAVAREAVVALGPWSDLVFGPLGYPIPLSVKRGYHLHLAPRGNAVLHHPVLDADLGFLLAPMNRGIRLTTGVEFARRDRPPTPVQLQRALPRAHALFPLGDPIDAKPWMGARPCLPDMLPVIGKGGRHPGLWFDFGHQHHGLTLGPASGRLLAEMMTGETPFADPRPFAAERFG